MVRVRWDSRIGFSKSRNVIGFVGIKYLFTKNENANYAFCFYLSGIRTEGCSCA